MGILYYFLATPYPFQITLITAKIFSIIILTIIIPAIFLFTVSKLKFVPNQKRVYLLTLIIILLVVNRQIITKEFFEIYSFYNGLVIAYMITLLLGYIRLNLSLRIISLSSFLVFITAISFLYQTPAVISISVAIALLGCLGTASLILTDQRSKELLIGIVVGLLSQGGILTVALMHYKI